MYADNEDCIAIGFWVSQETMTAARRFDHSLDLPFACVVADGMGGHNDDERASLLVARSLARRLDIEPHLLFEPCVPGATYLLCCDGLYEALTETEMTALIGEDLQASAEALLRTALERKARDNVTIVLVRFVPHSPA